MQNESGFTLVEVLVSLSIVSILAAVAVPQYQSYREGALDRQAQVALRNVALAEEGHFILHDEYLSCDQNTCPALLDRVPAISAGIVLHIEATGTNFEGSAYHEMGSGEIFRWND